MEEISLRDYFLIIKKRIWIVILLTVVPIVICGVMGVYDGKRDPEYVASTTLVVGGPKVYIDSKSKLDYETFKAMNGILISHFNELIKMEIVIDEVIDNLGLSISYREFLDKMNIEIIDNTEIIKIEVKDKNSNLATRIVDELVIVSSENAKRMMGIENIETINKTNVKAIPYQTKTKTNMVIAGIIGLVISIFIVFLLEYLDTSIEGIKDVKRHFKLPISGLIPNTEEKLTIWEAPDSLMAESYRTLRTNIENIKTDKKIKTILITSSNPEDEKALVAINIAISMAQIGKKVLLIDGNMREPELHDYFKIDNKFGLSNVLKGSIDLKNAIYIPKKEENLHFLTSGTSSSMPAELLASKPMEELLEITKKEYDLVIINSSSLGVVADAIIVSSIVDGTFIVCNSGETDIRDLKIGEKCLKKVDARILGVILNKVDVKKDINYRSYYSDYLYYMREK